MSNTTPNILSKSSKKQLASIKITIVRNIAGPSNSGELKRSLEEPDKLKVHNQDQISTPIFDREDVVVNKYACSASGSIFSDNNVSEASSSKPARSEKTHKTIEKVTTVQNKDQYKRSSPEKSIYKRRSRSHSPKNNKCYRNRTRDSSSPNYKRRSNSSPRRSHSPRYRKRLAQSPSYRKESHPSPPRYRDKANNYSRRSPSPKYRSRPEKYRREHSRSTSQEKSQGRSTYNQVPVKPELNAENFPFEYGYYVPAPHVNYFGRGMYPALHPRNFMMPVRPAYGIPRPYVPSPMHYYPQYRPKFYPKPYNKPINNCKTNRRDNEKPSNQTDEALDQADSTVNNKV